MHITFTEHLKGRTVLDSHGDVMGTLDEVLIDSDSWQIEGIRLKLSRDAGKDIGASSSVFHAASVDVPSNLIKAAGDAIILSASRTMLQELVKETAAESADAPTQPPAETIPH